VSSPPATAATVSPEQERVLVALAQRGDDEAFAALVRWGAPTALGAARRVTGDPALAEDAAQEAFLRAFRALADYRHESSFRAWIRRIAIHAAIDLMRRRRPESRLPETTAAPIHEEKRHEDADLLREVLRSLSVLDREILLAREIDGAPDRDLARRFAMTVTGVRVRIHRARKKLRAAFLENGR
jgi:RNA polymerase sigma-70 factor (ECF subfamily)